MAEQFVIPNPYLDQTEDTASRAALVLGALNGAAITSVTEPAVTMQFTTSFLSNLIQLSSAPRGDEPEEETHTRGARAVLWSLSLAVKSFADHGVDFTDPDPATNTGCNCGMDHEAHQRLYDAFLGASADGHPDSAVSAVVSALQQKVHHSSPDGLLYQDFGPMGLNHGERYFTSTLFDKAVHAVARKMFTPVD